MSEAVPLNLDHNYRINVLASSITCNCTSTSDQSPQSQSSRFFVRTLVYIHYTSSDRTVIWHIPDDFRSEKSFELNRIDSILSLSVSNISGMISGMKIPFPMENIHWIARESETTLKDLADLTNRILDFARSILRDRQSSENANGRVVGMILRVLKKITLPADEFEAMYKVRARARARAWENQSEEEHNCENFHLWENLFREKRGDVEFCRDMRMVLYRLHNLRKSEGGSKKSDDLMMGMKPWRADSEEECSICKDEMAIGYGVIRMPCSHKFHPNCIVKWLLRSAVCPLCRNNLLTNPH